MSPVHGGRASWRRAVARAPPDSALESRHRAKQTTRRVSPLRTASLLDWLTTCVCHSGSMRCRASTRMALANGCPCTSTTDDAPKPSAVWRLKSFNAEPSMRTAGEPGRPFASSRICAAQRGSAASCAAASAVKYRPKTHAGTIAIRAGEIDMSCNLSREPKNSTFSALRRGQRLAFSSLTLCRRGFE